MSKLHKVSRRFKLAYGAAALALGAVIIRPNPIWMNEVTRHFR